LLLAQNGTGFTAWQIAAQKPFRSAEKLWVWADDVQPNTKELKNKLFLVKDKDGYTAWHRAAEKGSLEGLEILRGWAREAELNSEKLLLFQSGKGYAAWQIAAQKFNLEALKTLWAWGKEQKMHTNELKTTFSLAKDWEGYTPWHRAAHKGSLRH